MFWLGHLFFWYWAAWAACIFLKWTQDSIYFSTSRSPLPSSGKLLANSIRRNIAHTATATAKSLQSCPTLCDPTDGSPPGSAVPGIPQARTLEWVAISFPIVWKWKAKVKTLSRVRPSVTPWTAAYQAPLTIGFSRQEYWSRLPLPSPYLAIICFKRFCPACIVEIDFRNFKSHGYNLRKFPFINL